MQAVMFPAQTVTIPIGCGWWLARPALAKDARAGREKGFVRDSLPLALFDWLEASAPGRTSVLARSLARQALLGAAGKSAWHNPCPIRLAESRRGAHPRFDRTDVPNLNGHRVTNDEVIS